MGFFAALGRLLGGGKQPVAEADRKRLLEAWELYQEPAPSIAFPETIGPSDAADEALGVSTGPPPGPAATHEYDRQQWHKKLKTLLDRLPDSQDQWDDLMSDVGALGLDAEWVKSVQREEFILLVRRAVADRTITPMEHRKLDMARMLIGMPEDEAERILNEIVAEAESFFGGEVEGAH